MKNVMRVFIKSLLCGVLPFALLLGGLPVSAYTGNSAQTLTGGADIRVMSYNTLVDDDEANGGWSWGKPLADRAEKAAAAIDYYRPDVIGLQENNYNWHVALRALLPDYDYVNANVPISMPLEKQESLGKKDWMCTTMMYNTKTLELLDRELFGYSVNYWGCIQRMRYVSMALFKVKATGEMFVFTSTHFDAEKDSKGQKYRVIQAGELAENIQRYKETYGCPIISTGDFNSGYNEDPIKNIRETTGMDSHANNRGGIDYILYSQGVQAKYFTVINDADLSGASDHQPIMADLALQDDFAFPTTTTTTVPTILPVTSATETTTTTSAATTTVATTVAPSVTETTTVSLDASVTETTTTAVADEPTASATETLAPSENAPTTATTAPISEDKQTVANPVKKGNDKLLYIGIAAAVVAIGVFIAVVYSVKKK